MKKQIKDVLEILRTAIDAETKAFVDYYSASKNVSIPELKGLLLSLAEEERKHKIILLNEYNIVKEQGYSQVSGISAIKKHEIRYKIPKYYKPKSLQKIPEIDMSGITLPTEIIGGDYLDTFLIEDKRRGINALGIILFDAMGHGLSATYIKSHTRIVFQKLRESFSKGTKNIKLFGPSNVADKINRSIADKCERNASFVTMFYCLIDLNKKELYYTSAGHEPPIYISKNEDSSGVLGTTQLLLGFEKNFKYAENKIKINSGDLLVLFTDGIIEATDSKGTMLGKNRLVETLSKYKNKSSSVILDKTLYMLNNHIGKTFLNDELSLLVAKIK